MIRVIVGTTGEPIKNGDDVIVSDTKPGMVMKNNRQSTEYQDIIGYALTDVDKDGNIVIRGRD